MKITQLNISNVKRIKAVQITPTGALVTIGGKNGAGKSSVLDSIWYTLGGASASCDQPIRNGEKKAESVLHISGDEPGKGLIVTRRITEAGSYLTVANEDGAAYKSPQAIIDRLGTKAIDPLAFTRLSPKQQVDAMRELIGMDFSELDNERAKTYEMRTDCNRKVADMKSQLAALTFHPDTPTEVIEVGTLVDQLKQAEDKARLHEQNDNRIIQADEAIKQKQAAIRAAKDELDKMIVDYNELLERCDREDSETSPDCAELHEKISQAGEINRKVFENEHYREGEKILKSHEGLSLVLSARINEIDEKKRELVASAEWPVDGLGFGDGGLNYNGIPFSQCSSAEQLRVSVAMGLALNPTLRVMLIRDGSLLDDSSLAMIGELAKEADAQIWIERVGEGKECQVIIEDGEVQGVEAETLEEVPQ